MTYEVREADAFVAQRQSYAGLVRGRQAAYDAAMFALARVPKRGRLITGTRLRALPARTTPRPAFYYLLNEEECRVLLVRIGPD